MAARFAIEEREAYQTANIEGVFMPVGRARKRVAVLEVEVPPGAGEREALAALAGEIERRLNRRPVVVEAVDYYIA
jgi:hypothetical protein